MPFTPPDGSGSGGTAGGVNVSPFPLKIHCISGGYKAILEEPIPTNSASTQIFANAPAGTKHIVLTVRTATLHLRDDGNTATSTNGQDFGISSAPYDLPITYAQALNVRAIGGATGFISYFGLA